jgi:hypothetical protein
VRFTYEAAPGASAGDETVLAFVGCLGSHTVWPTELTVAGETFRPLRLAGRLTVAGDGMWFRRGDANTDQRVDISDAITTLGYLFAGERELVTCLSAADANDDGTLDIADAVQVLSHLFGGTGPLPAPAVCGPDPTSDELGCVSYPPCR